MAPACPVHPGSQSDGSILSCCATAVIHRQVYGATTVQSPDHLHSPDPALSFVPKFETGMPVVAPHRFPVVPVASFLLVPVSYTHLTLPTIYSV